MPVSPEPGGSLSRQRLLEVARSLPANLQVLAALGELLQDGNTELDDISELLKRDLALTARIVRISNSPVFGGAGRVAAVEEAVNRVGFSEILRLVGMATVSRLTEQRLECYDVPARLVHDAMLHTALACEALAGPAGEDGRTAYTLGLMRPLGILVLDRSAQGRLGQNARYDASRWKGYSAWEGQVFGIDNCEVTGLILDEWKFPRELGTAVRDHYLLRGVADVSRLACLLHLASVLAQDVGRVLPGEKTYWQATPERLAAAGIDADMLRIAGERAAAEFERLQEAFG
jgi:HD-like signal output (HDOD) protein